MNCRYIFLMMVLGLTGCATPQPPDFTVRNVTPVKNKQQAELRSITVVYDANAKTNVAIGAFVPSNVDSASLWREALTDALNRSVAFQDDQKLKVSLSVRIMEIDAHEFLRTHLTITALYEVIDRATGKILFKEVVEGTGINDELMNRGRPKLMFEAAVRENIRAFITALSEVQLVER